VTDDPQAQKHARERLRDRWRAEGYYARQSVGEALASGAHTHPTSPLILATEDSIYEATRMELHERARRLAAGFAARGMTPGDVVVLQSPASIHGVVALEAILLLGAVVVPVVPDHGASELANAITDSKATALVVPDTWRSISFADRALEVVSSTPGDQQIFVLAANAPDGTVATQRLLAASEPISKPRPREPSDLCAIIYTSGSTADPKGVMHSHETLLASILARRAQRANDAMALMSYPVGHIASLRGILRPLILGGATVIMDRWSPSRAASLIERFAVTTSGGTPFFLATLMDTMRKKQANLSSLQRYIVGAAPVSASLAADAERAGIVTWRAYGSTEHPAISVGSADDPVERRHGTDGRPSAGNEVRIVDQSGNDVPYGQDGEIVSRGPNQFIGYSNPRFEDTAFLAGTWFHTGDIGRIDASGYLSVTGRLKDVIIRGGENISAGEIESMLIEHPLIREAAVCGAPEPLLGEEVCVFVLPATRTPPSLSSLQRYLVDRGLSSQKIPTRLETVTALPRTPSGKIDKRNLRRQLGSAGRNRTERDTPC
jgi:acyl-CoA synthetase (AMP-forming)/AMP-acid ligase II